MPEELLEAWYLLPGPQLSLMGWMYPYNSDSNHRRSTHHILFKGFHWIILESHYFLFTILGPLKLILCSKWRVFHPFFFILNNGALGRWYDSLRPKTPRKVFLPGKPWKKSGPEMFEAGGKEQIPIQWENIRHISSEKFNHPSKWLEIYLKYIFVPNRMPWNTDVSWSLKDLINVAITSGSFQVLLHSRLYTLSPSLVFQTVSSLPGTLNNAWGTSPALRTSAGRNSMQRSVIHSILWLDCQVSFRVVWKLRRLTFFISGISIHWY